jgi:Icc-related predicted phosphoesterase
MSKPLVVVALSDTHGLHKHVAVPPGDVLIHAGDICKVGHMSEVKKFAKWLDKLPHKHKLIVPGNHDKAIEERLHEARQVFEKVGAWLLVNEEAVINGVKFWGSPVTPTFLHWYFMKDRGPEIAEVWSQIPWDVDVIITHGPPYGHGGLAPPYRTPCPKEAGCLELLKRIKQIHVASGYMNPRYHVFGHIHDGYSATQSDEFGGLVFINASTCNEQYQPVNRPLEFEVRAKEESS